MSVRPQWHYFLVTGCHIPQRRSIPDDLVARCQIGCLDEMFVSIAHIPKTVQSHTKVVMCLREIEVRAESRLKILPCLVHVSLTVCLNAYIIVAGRNCRRADWCRYQGLLWFWRGLAALAYQQGQQGHRDESN